MKKVMIITTAEDFSELPVFEDQESWILITDQALEKVDNFDRSIVDPKNRTID